MKKKIYSATLFLMTVCASTGVICSCSDDETYPNDPEVATKVNVSGQTDDHDYVDLGLPSGTLWATCNIGASKPEEFGSYFAWGETVGNSQYTLKSNWDNYKYSIGTNDSYWLTKYCSFKDKGYIVFKDDYTEHRFTDGKQELDIEDDAATANWGNHWQMPSKEQFEELINEEYTITKWAVMNGICGRLITSKRNGNTIFLPSATSVNSADYEHPLFWFYWSRFNNPEKSVDASKSCGAFYLYFNQDGIGIYSFNRCYRISVRPVRNMLHVLVNEDGTTSNGSIFSVIDDNNFYVDQIKYTIEGGYLVVSGYEEGFNGVAKIISTLTYKNITYKVLKIKEDAFSKCNGLTSVTMPNVVTCIGDNAFQGCENLTSVNIGNSVTSIGKNAFQGCHNLTSVSIPNCVTTIGSSAFSETPWFNNWFNNQPDGLVYISRVVYCYKGTIPDETKIIIEEGDLGIAGIADKTFYGCKGLTSVTIPYSVTNIGDHAFFDCINLTSVTVKAIEPPTIELSTFNNQHNATLYVHKGYKAAYQAAKGWKDFKEIIEIEIKN